MYVVCMYVHIAEELHVLCTMAGFGFHSCVLLWLELGNMAASCLHIYIAQFAVCICMYVCNGGCTTSIIFKYIYICTVVQMHEVFLHQHILYSG